MSVSGKLLPLRDLNNGFVRPTSPDQIGLSYYQASLVVEHLEATRGLPALLALLAAFKDGKSTPEAFETALSESVDDFDKHFRAALDERVAKPLAAIRPIPPKTVPSRELLETRAKSDDSDFIAHALLGKILFSEKRLDEARTHLERAVALSNGHRAWPLVTFAETVSVSLQERREFERLLRQALAIDADAAPALRVTNLLAQRRARWLLSRSGELFLEAPSSSPSPSPSSSSREDDE